MCSIDLCCRRLSAACVLSAFIDVLFTIVTDGFGLKIAPYEVLTEKCTLLIGWLVVTYACNVAVLPAKFSSREYQIAVVWMNLAGVLCLVIDSPSMFLHHM